MRRTLYTISSDLRFYSLCIAWNGFFLYFLYFLHNGFHHILLNHLYKWIDNYKYSYLLAYPIENKTAYHMHTKHLQNMIQHSQCMLFKPSWPSSGRSACYSILRSHLTVAVHVIQAFGGHHKWQVFLLGHVVAFALKMWPSISAMLIVSASRFRWFTKKVHRNINYTQ